MRKQRIFDIHCHLLPGVDDGSESIRESILALQEYVRQGITDIILTPHYYPGVYEVSAEMLWRRYASFKEILAKEHLPIHTWLGTECFYFSGLVEKLNSGEVLTLADSRYVLLEFDPDVSFSMMEYGLSELIRNGYNPILAHFERYECLRDFMCIRRLKQMGVLLQMNYEPLRKKDKLFQKNPWRKMVQEGFVDFLGSDCHGTHFRPIHADEVLNWMTSLNDVQRDRLLRVNAQMIVELH